LNFGGTSTRRGRRRFGVAAALAVAFAASLGVTAAPAHAATTLELDAGYAGMYAPGQPIPVRVRVAADRLLAADLAVAVDGAPTSVAIEVPGATTKEFLVVVPPAAAQSGPVTVTARLADGTRHPPVATTQLSAPGSTEVVGLLPGALAGRAVPGPAPLAVDAGTARFVALGPLELERAPDSLRALGTIAAAGDELAREAPSVRNALLNWVESGGRLLLDERPGVPVEGLPDGWQPGSDGRASIGSGEIRLTDGAISAGRWAGLVEPTRRDSSLTVRVGTPPLGDLLASRAGFHVPRITWLVGFLIAYVALLGPGLYLLLRRRRPELGWLVIPLVSLVFAGASYGAGRGLREGTQLVHATLLATGRTGTTALAYLGVSSRAGGTAKLDYPPGWLVGGRDPSSPASKVTEVRSTGSGSEGRLPLDAGQFAVVAARGPASVQGTLEVTAVSAADGVATGTIRNATRLHLDGAAVVVGNGAVVVGGLAPGEQRDWRLANLGQVGGPPAEFTIWGRTTGEQTVMTESLWNAGQGEGLITRDLGSAVAMAWTNEYVPPVRVGGRAATPSGTTLVVATTPVAASGPRASDVSVRADVVRTPGPDSRGTVVRFALPQTDHPIDPANLGVRLPTPVAAVWTGDTWTDLPCPPGLCPTNVAPCVPGDPCAVNQGRAVVNGPGREVVLPSEALRDGVVYVRMSGSFPTITSGLFSIGLREMP
jgi:hypothetical protein